MRHFWEDIWKVPHASCLHPHSVFKDLWLIRVGFSGWAGVGCTVRELGSYILFPLGCGVLGGHCSCFQVTWL